MKKVCINCHKTFGNGSDDIKTHTGSICDECMELCKQRLIDMFRSRQIKEGNPDCFFRSFGYCDNINCVYYDACVYGEFKVLSKTTI